MIKNWESFNEHNIDDDGFVTDEINAILDIARDEGLQVDYNDQSQTYPATADSERIQLFDKSVINVRRIIDIMSADAIILMEDVDKFNQICQDIKSRISQIYSIDTTYMRPAYGDNRSSSFQITIWRRDNEYG
jgi:hypothetical protein